LLSLKKEDLNPLPSNLPDDGLIIHWV